MGMKFNYDIITKSNSSVETSKEVLAKCNAATQTLAIIADALGNNNVISSFTPKGESEVRYFISAEKCKDILTALMK